MPSSLPRAVLRASEQQKERWRARAHGEGKSVNTWAVEILDRAVDLPPEGVTALASAAPVEVEECPRQHLHRAGVFCKSCGFS